MTGRDPLAMWTEADTALRGEHHCPWWLAGANVRLEELRPLIDAAEELARLTLSGAPELTCRIQAREFIYQIVKHLTTPKGDTP